MQWKDIKWKQIELYIFKLQKKNLSSIKKKSQIRNVSATKNSYNL